MCVSGVESDRFVYLLVHPPTPRETEWTTPTTTQITRFVVDYRRVAVGCSDERAWPASSGVAREENNWKTKRNFGSDN